MANNFDKSKANLGEDLSEDRFLKKSYFLSLDGKRSIITQKEMAIDFTFI